MRIRKNRKRSFTHIDQEKFKPWRKDFYIAFALWFLGCLWIGLALYGFYETQNYYVSMLGILSVPFFYFGFSWFECGLSRIYGVKVERQEKEALSGMLPEDWKVLPEVLMKNDGNIDLILQLPTKEIVVIDIKAFNYWSGFIRKLKSINQVRRQKQYMKTKYGIIWLPKAKQKYAQWDKSILVVCGRIKFLFNKIEEILESPVIVKFVRMPSDDMRAFLKLSRFKWDKLDKSWKGVLTRKQIKEMQSEISKESGFLYIVDDQANV